jgi:hypothetical protein
MNWAASVEKQAGTTSCAQVLPHHQSSGEKGFEDAGVDDDSGSAAGGLQQSRGIKCICIA